MELLWKSPKVNISQMDVLRFFKVMMTGESKVDAANRRVTDSIAQDITLTATDAEWKLPKHILSNLAFQLMIKAKLLDEPLSWGTEEVSHFLCPPLFWSPG